MEENNVLHAGSGGLIDLGMRGNLNSGARICIGRIKALSSEG